MSERFRTFSIRLPEGMYRRLRMIAAAERRRLGPQIVKLLEENIARLQPEDFAETRR